MVTLDKTWLTCEWRFVRFVLGWRGLEELSFALSSHWLQSQRPQTYEEDEKLWVEMKWPDEKLWSLTFVSNPKTSDFGVDKNQVSDLIRYQNRLGQVQPKDQMLEKHATPLVKDKG